jgi:hypothetical protein|tara:strand:+ start:98 stop:391 length:294 start_codon:yes stop_codon:yes gene_type:complete
MSPRQVPRLSREEINKKKRLINNNVTTYPNENLGRSDFYNPINSSILIAYKQQVIRQRETLNRRAGNKLSKKRKTLKKRKKYKKKNKNKIDSNNILY